VTNSCSVQVVPTSHVCTHRSCLHAQTSCCPFKLAGRNLFPYYNPDLTALAVPFPIHSSPFRPHLGCLIVHPRKRFASCLDWRISKNTEEDLLHPCHQPGRTSSLLTTGCGPARVSQSQSQSRNCDRGLNMSISLSPPYMTFDSVKSFSMNG
jgi:hypothetical protein